MRVYFREGLYVGSAIALLIGLYCLWLWQPERQVNRHTQNFLQKIERKDWAGVADFIAPDYTDQWGHDRGLVLERMAEVFRYLRNVQFSVTNANVSTDNYHAIWRGRIAVEGEESEAIVLVKQRVNSLTTPFELEWRRTSGKPWDWKLVRVSNPDLEIPADFD